MEFYTKRVHIEPEMPDPIAKWIPLIRFSLWVKHKWSQRNTLWSRKYRQVTIDQFYKTLTDVSKIDWNDGKEVGEGKETTIAIFDTIPQ